MSPSSHGLPKGGFTIAAWSKAENYTYPRTTLAVQWPAHSAGIAGSCYQARLGLGRPGWDFGHDYSNGVGTRFCMHDTEGNQVDATLVFDAGAQPWELVGQWVHQVFIVDRHAGRLSAVVNGRLMSNTIDISSIKGLGDFDVATAVGGSDDDDVRASVNSSVPLALNRVHGWRFDGTIDEFRMYA